MDQIWLLVLKRKFPGRLRHEEYIIEVCPYCGNTRKNMEINTRKLVFHCWVCGTGGTVRGFFRDFDLPIDDLPETPEGRREELPQEQADVVMPTECKDILKADDILGKWAKTYLLSTRGFTEHSILRFGCQYASEGDLKARIIVPLYEDDELIYYVARTYVSDFPKYKNPKIRRRNALPIYFGNDSRMTAVLVEDTFSAMQVNLAGYSSIPLLGTSMTNEQIRKLEKRNFNKVIVMLDPDAKAKAMALATRIKVEGMDTTVALPATDPDELELDEIRTAVEESKAPSLQTKIEDILSRRLG